MKKLFIFSFLVLVFMVSSVSGLIWSNTTFNNSLSEENLTFVGAFSIIETNNIGTNLRSPSWEYCTNITLTKNGAMKITFNIEDDIAPYAIVRIRNENKELMEEINDTDNDETISTVNGYLTGKYGICLAHTNSSDDTTSYDVTNNHDGYVISGSLSDPPYFKIDSIAPYLELRWLAVPEGVGFVTDTFLNLSGYKIITDYFLENPNENGNFGDNPSGGYAFSIQTLGLNKTFYNQKIDKIGFYFDRIGTVQGSMNFSIYNSSLDRIHTQNWTQDVNGFISTSENYYEINITNSPLLNGNYYIGPEIFNTTTTDGSNFIKMFRTSTDVSFFNPYNESRFTKLDDGSFSFDNPPSISIPLINITYIPRAYPHNLSIEIGTQDGIHEWNYTGQFNQTNNRTNNLFSAVNSYVSSCTISNGFCLVPFLFHSDTIGILQYLDMLFSNEGFVENSQTFDSQTVSLSTETFNINLSYDSNRYNSISATLVYNNTEFSSTSSGSGNDKVFTSTISIPSVSATINKTFYWDVTLIDSSSTQHFNSTFNNQSVVPFQIDDCSVNTELILNYTLKDEETTNTLATTAAENTSIEIEAIITSTADTTQTITFSKTYNSINPAQVCLGAGVLGNGTWTFDVQARYTAEPYVTEFHNIQNATLSASNFPQNIDLFPLLTADSQEFVITFKDDSFTPVQDALITITRKYVGEGLFRTVEAPLTNIDGQTIAHLVIADVLYTIQVSKNGALLATFDNVVAFCSDITIGECEINLDSFSTGINPTDFDTVNDLTYNMNFDKTARTITVIFTVPSGAVSTVGLNATLFDNRGNTTVCSDSLTSSSGTLTCNIPASFGNVSVLAILTKDGSIINSAVYTIKQNVNDLFGGTGYLFFLLLYMSLPLMMITTGPGMIIAAIMGLIFGALLNIFNTNNIIGVGSTIMWFIIAGGIIAWKVVKREQ